MIVLVHFNRDFMRKNPMLEHGFELTTFWLASSCLGFTFLSRMCISPFDHFAPIGSQALVAMERSLKTTSNPQLRNRPSGWLSTPPNRGRLRCWLIFFQPFKTDISRLKVAHGRAGVRVPAVVEPPEDGGRWEMRLPAGIRRPLLRVLRLRLHQVSQIYIWSFFSF